MYTGWQVENVVEIGVNVAELCTQTPHFIYLFSWDMELYPTPLNIICPSTGCNASNCISTNGRQVTFFSCKNYNRTLNDVKCSNSNYDKYYRQIGTATTDSNGIAKISYIVTPQDLADYNDAILGGGEYNIVVCINDSLATSSHSTYWNVTVASAPPPPPGPTHYIEYNLSFLPSNFLSLIGINITDISNWIGNKLPLPSNITYFNSEYANGHFKIYVGYTGTLSYPYSSYLSETNYFDNYNNYNDYNHDYKFTTLEIPLSIQVLAGLIGGMITFALMVYIIGRYAPWVLESVYGIGGVVIASILTAVAIGWTVHDITTDAKTSGTKTPDPYIDIKSQGDFATLTRQKCLELSPGCNTGNCSVISQRNYNACMGAIDLAQYVNDHKVNGTYSQTGYDDLKNSIQSTDTCLGNGQCTTQQAAAQIANRTNASNTNHASVLNQIECPGQVWDVKKLKCVPKQGCLIPGPLGTCILTADAGKSILLFGGLLVGGYIGLKLLTGHKSQELIVKAAKS